MEAEKACSHSIKHTITHTQTHIYKSRLMPTTDTERLKSFHLVPVSIQQAGSNVDKKPGKEG